MEEKTILIVDDEEMNIKLLKSVLEIQKHHIIEARNGEEALKKVSDSHPDLILLDVMMPGIDGFEVCKRLKQDEKTMMIPIVMITALREKEHRIKAMKVGADDFLNKPVDHVELSVRIKSLLRIKSYYDELLKSYAEIDAKNRQLKELEEVKEGLTHMIIHDLNNPLTAILGNLEVLKAENTTLSGDSIDKIQKCIDYSHNLGQMIRTLLDIYKMEEGELKPEKEVTDISELINEVVDQFESKANLSQISIKYAKPDDMPPVDIDRSLIKRIIENLLSNAIRHSPKGKEIIITTDFFSEEKRLCLRMKDNGNGIAPEVQKNIFDKFKQVKLKEAGVKVGSSGLGLTYCKMAVEAHGGKIWVESSGEGKGSSFIFIISTQ